jgi:hypothetical protein
LIERESRDEHVIRTNISRKSSAKRRQRSPSRAKSLLRHIPRILARLREAQKTAVLLDCDGTLVPLRRHPSDVRVPVQVKKVLARLVRNPRLFVAIVSGRRVRDLKALLDVKVCIISDCTAPNGAEETRESRPRLWPLFVMLSRLRGEVSNNGLAFGLKIRASPFRFTIARQRKQ